MRAVAAALLLATAAVYAGLTLPLQRKAAASADAYRAAVRAAADGLVAEGYMLPGHVGYVMVRGGSDATLLE